MASTATATGPALDDLRGQIRGEVITGGDPAYAEACRIWNGMIEREPALVVRCGGSADVIAAVRFAREAGLPVSVRSGGHNVAGTALCDGLVGATPVGAGPLFAGLEIERYTIHAIALASGLWTVVENMTEMSAAAAAVDFRARHEEAAVGVGFDRVIEGRREARPAGAAVEFFVGSEDRLPATGAVVDSAIVLLVQWARPGPLGAVLAQHAILRRRQFAPPFILAQRNRKRLLAFLSPPT